ncbi:MAG: sodium-dependent transporter [Eubacterium sp.]|nr:sodium-dependent transporter [Eubacterium sp.]
MTQKRTSFSGGFGFVLAAAGSAVGLGNIWRFPYLAAKDGGGIFLLVYLILALTFGFTLLTAEVAIGRKTQQGPLTAYNKLKSGKMQKLLGILACVVPFIILPYYCDIGGWVLKYFVAFVTGHGTEAAEDGYFGGFITSEVEPIVYMVIFLVIIAAIIFIGVNKGIELSSRILMPILLVMIIGVAIFSLFISHTDESGVTTTGLDGLKALFIPDFEGMTFQKFIQVVVDAMGQLFFSLSIAMGIMIAYGSYVNKEANLVKSINEIEIFDTAVAFLAGTMIIPAVYVFQGAEGMKASGPSLMFVSLPKVFAEMGTIGNVVGAVFFAMVLFAAITSAMSILEAVVSSLIDRFQLSRKVATIQESIMACILAVIVCLGYNILYVEIRLPNMSEEQNGQILDIMDYISNSVLMPIVAILTCVLIGWIVKPKTIIDECQTNGEKLGRRGLFSIMIRYVAPVFLFLLFLQSSGIFRLLGIEYFG